MKKYGIFGGTFNPPHIAHSIVADNVRQQLSLDKIIFIPSGNPPLKESISAEHRLSMAKLAFGNDKNFEVSEIEIEDTENKSYTVNTLCKLKKKYENTETELYLIIGMDNLIDLPNWKDPEKLFELAKIIVINRPENNKDDARKDFREKAVFVDVPDLEISSRMIRRNISEGKPVKYLVSDAVEEYIEKNGLYKE